MSEGRRPPPPPPPLSCCCCCVGYRETDNNSRHPNTISCSLLFWAQLRTQVAPPPTAPACSFPPNPPPKDFWTVWETDGGGGGGTVFPPFQQLGAGIRGRRSKTCSRSSCFVQSGGSRRNSCKIRGNMREEVMVAGGGRGGGCGAAAGERVLR